MQTQCDEGHKKKKNNNNNGNTSAISEKEAALRRPQEVLAIQSFSHLVI